MNVYDFDNTILRGDSTARFFAYCLVHRPAMWLDLPGQAVNGLLFALKIREKQAFKERMLRFLTRIGDVDAAVAAFWEKNFRRVKAWYFQIHRDDDVVISASPEFIVRPALDRLGVKTLLGTHMNPLTGRITGRNCHGAEKVVRFHQEMGDAQVDEFYSDSLSDAPMARLAKKAFLVHGERLVPWPKDD